MLNYRNTSLAALFAVIILAGVGFFFTGVLFVMIPVVVAYLGLLAYGSVFVCSGFYIPAVCRGDPGETKRIALTFDDGPDERITPAVLDMLSESGIKATFFCTGSKAALYPAIVRRMVAEGHLVGNHSDTHGWFFDLKTYRRIKDDFQQAENIITGITGLRTRWMRPPYGVTNPALARAAKKLRYRIAGWTVRTMDSTTSDMNRAMRRVKAGWQPGAIILLHDSHDRLPLLLGEILEHGRNTGYSFARLDELTGEEAYKT